MPRAGVNMRELILMVVPELSPHADATAIFDAITKLGSDLNQKSYVYTVLKKMVRERLLWSWWEPQPIGQVGVRRRKYYALTEAGHQERERYEEERRMACGSSTGATG